jgi:sec-independent protein translocase protein TatA
MRIGAIEIILIIVLALILFGGAKIAGLGKTLGKSIKEFRNEIKSDEPASGAAGAAEAAPASTIVPAVKVADVAENKEVT